MFAAVRRLHQLLRFAARTARIARFISTQRSPRTPRARFVRDVIHEFKYNRQIHLRHLVARWLRAALDDERLRDCEFDVIVPVPLHPARQRERRLQPSSLPAGSRCAQTSTPCRPLLNRIRYTTTQTALDRSERMENLHNAFRLTEKRGRARLAGVVNR